MPQWTKSQNCAINARNSNILVSAAAGSGKTAVLVERVTQIITDAENPVNVDKLLIVTFTNAAAAEMKSRIAARLEKIISENPNDINAQRQISLLSGAKICTIDAFCLNLVKENFFNLGIGQDFKILDQAEADIIAENALDTILNNFFEQNDSAFLKLTELLSSPKDDKALISAIKKIHAYIYSQPFPLKWLREMAELYNPDISLENSVWHDYLCSEIKDALFAALDLVSQSRMLLDANDELYDKLSSMLISDESIIQVLIDKTTNSSWDDIIKAFTGVKFSTFPSKRGYVSPVKEELMARRTAYKDIVTKDLKGLFCSFSDDYTQDMQELYPLFIKLCEVVEAYDIELLALKNENNGYTFSDVEHFAIKLLVDFDENGTVCRSKLAEEMVSDFHEILIDEYQDTNEAQEIIYSLLSNGCNRFMVGDVKQSIYRFRLAMPHIFVAKRNQYSDYQNGTAVDSKIILDKNFRSRSQICSYVNYVFSAFMSESVGEINYDKSEYLNCGADYEDNGIVSAQLKILKNVKSEDFDKSEAAYIANTILNKVSSGELVKDGDSYRSIRFGDFAILLRSTKKHIAEYNEVLTSYGIPVICDNTSNLFDSNEIKILLSLLRVIDNPMQDIPLLAVMMSPLYGFTADEMAAIKTENNYGASGLYTSVVNSQAEKVKNFRSEIEMFSKMVVTMSVSSFIRYVCEFKSIYAFANALGNGEQRCRNISRFISFAASFDASGSVGLTAFMRYADRVSESEKGIESASLNSETENAVSIMSVHHSKGLEFPVVILAGASRQYNKMDLSSKILLNPFLGLGMKVHNDEFLYEYKTIPYTVIQNLNKASLMSENLRVLYVAMTRAKEQFITFVTTENLNSKINGLSLNVANGTVSPYLCKKVNSDADFLLMAALMHTDGVPLRSHSEILINTISADFPIDIEIVETADEVAEQHSEASAEPDSALIDEIRSRISYEYKNKALSTIAAKRTASDLDESVKNFDYFASSKPAFMNDGEMTPGEKGTAMHSFMQFCDYANSKNDLEAEIKRLTDSAYITEKQADSLNRQALKILFNSELAGRMFNSEHIYREFKISSFVKACDIADVDSDEEVLVQGISDCVFEENGELVLVDYKTDSVKNENQLLNMYKNQIAFYKKAVSKALGKNVKQALLYSFKLGKICEYK